MHKKTLYILIFLLILVVLLWIMPIQKVESIGDFFYKIISPIGLPTGVFLGARYIFSRKNKDTS